MIQQQPLMSPSAKLARLSALFHVLVHTSDPFTATMLGVLGFDALVPDPSREGSAATIAKILKLESELVEIDPLTLNREDQVNHAVLTQLAWGARSDLEHALWETGASADGYSAPHAMMFMSVPNAPLNSGADLIAYLQRLSDIPEFLRAILARYLQAKSEGRLPTRVGVGQAMEQLTGHLSASIESDVFLSPKIFSDPEFTSERARVVEILTNAIRPAMQELLMGLANELLPFARSDEQVGIRFVPGGVAGYRAAVRRHTTTELSPEEIHQIGLERLVKLDKEWAELGSRVFGTRDVAEIRARLRSDPSLRFSQSSEILSAVTAALNRAEVVRDKWFPHYEIAECAIEEINPIEAGNAALAHYRPPSGDGSRAGAHCVLTTDPERRFLYEYEALAFHESTPGHHLQISVAQTLTHLPEYRRFLDAEVCGFVEGWGLYSERLADEMGLYTSDIARLGMFSFEALRACRLVVDTGIHYMGWSRQRAIDFMWENTATTQNNVRNEIDRYISWPGQALAYLIGAIEIRRLRTLAEAELGAEFDIRSFHGVVLGNGAVPLGVLAGIVKNWITSRAKIN